MANIIPQDCPECERVFGIKLRDPVFIAAIRERQELTKQSFGECVSDFMHAFHNWEHIDR